ncbi:MAG TPA: Mth938-like domain-containing protein [Zeimonas sp.]|nr:Mth938-like domain-containing protein [Zeimonas sp.]
MKLHAQTPGGTNLFTGYGDGWFAVNGERHTGSLLVVPEQAVIAWGVTAFDALTEADFERLLALEPELVLFGTGTRQRFPHPRLTAPLASRQIGLEVMDTGAACRTYNILAGEGRRALAALLPTG